MICQPCEQPPPRDEPTGRQDGPGAGQHSSVGGDDVEALGQPPSGDKIPHGSVARSLGQGQQAEAFRRHAGHEPVGCR